MFTSLGNVIIKPFDGRNPAPVNSYLHICIYIHLYIIISYVSIYPIPGGKQYLHCASISKLFCCWLPASPFLPSRCRASGATSRKGRGSGWQVRRMPWFMEIGVGFSPALGLIRGDDGGESSSLMKAPISWNDIPPSSPQGLTYEGLVGGVGPIDFHGWLGWALLWCEILIDFGGSLFTISKQSSVGQGNLRRCSRSHAHLCLRPKQ